jgi:hypothetical protein
MLDLCTGGKSIFNLQRTESSLKRPKVYANIGFFSLDLIDTGIFNYITTTTNCYYAMLVYTRPVHVLLDQFIRVIRSGILISIGIKRYVHYCSVWQNGRTFRMTCLPRRDDRTYATELLCYNGENRSIEIMYLTEN